MFKESSARLWASSLTAAALLVLAIAFAYLLRYRLPLSASFLEKTELRTLDARFLIRGPRPISELQEVASQVAIVAIDDAATGRFSRVLPRETHAQLVSRLRKAGARAIIFDVIFADPSPRGLATDAVFAREIKAAGNVFLPFDHDSSRKTPPQLESKIRERLAYPMSTPATAETVRIRPPVSPLFEAVRGGGHIASKRDSDGTFRSSILLMEVDAVYPHAVLDAVAKTVWKLDLQKNPPQIEQEFLRLGDKRIGPLEKRPLERSVYHENRLKNVRTGTAWAIPLNFLGGHDAMQVLTVPYLEVLEGRADKRIKNRIVIVGETATGTFDLRRSPFDRQDEFLGVETNATFIANLLDNDFLRYPPLWWGVLAACLMGLVSGVAAFGMRPIMSLFVAVGVLIIYAIVCVQVFLNDNFVLETTLPFLCVVFAYTLLTAFRLVVTDKAAREYSAALRETQTLLGQYVDEGLARRLSADPEMRRDLQIGTRREVTVLFSDIRSFTSWAEKQPPEEVKARLDEYFPIMCEIIADDYDGDVDKFIGDGMMAVWNGLSDQSDHARRAVRAALSMKRALALLNDGWRKQKQDEFRIGIGISTGMAVFGTFGSPRHKLMPTVLGDTVNLASRLEALTKETGAVIIISQSTYEIVKDEFEVRPLGSVPVRGRSEVQPMYEVLDVKK